MADPLSFESVSESCSSSSSIQLDSFACQEARPPLAPPSDTPPPSIATTTAVVVVVVSFETYDHSVCMRVIRATSVSVGRRVGVDRVVDCIN